MTLWSPCLLEAVQPNQLQWVTVGIVKRVSSRAAQTSTGAPVLLNSTFGFESSSWHLGAVPAGPEWRYRHSGPYAPGMRQPAKALAPDTLHESPACKCDAIRLDVPIMCVQRGIISSQMGATGEASG